MMVCGQMTTSLRRTIMGCGWRENTRVRWMLIVIVLFCVASSVFLWIKLTNKPKESAISRKDGRVSVLLFSYYRSGSILGSMFNLNPDAFYWFEPLAAPTEKWGWVADKIPPRNHYHYDNGSEKLIPLEDLHETLLSPLDLIFDCNITALSPIFFTWSLSKWLLKMTAFADYHRCLSQSHPSFKTEATYRRRLASLYFQRCLPHLPPRCRRSSIVAVKTIRLRMDLAEEMLRRDATLRLVYMVRDPRGILNSWWISTDIALKIRKGRYGAGAFEADARLMCKRMLNDWLVFSRLRGLYPDRCLQFRYEDLAASPESVVQMVYRFLGFKDAPREVLMGFREMTSANSSDGVFGVHRTNSSATSQAWKTQMPRHRQKIIVDNCRELIQAMRYQ